MRIQGATVKGRLCRSALRKNQMPAALASTPSGSRRADDRDKLGFGFMLQKAKNYGK
jgi:hypothetical protein